MIWNDIIYVFQILLHYYILQNKEYSIYSNEIYCRSDITYLVQRIG